MKKILSLAVAALFVGGSLLADDAVQHKPVPVKEPVKVGQGIQPKHSHAKKVKKPKVTTVPVGATTTAK